MRPVSTRKLLTAEDLLRAPDRFARGELWDGAFVVGEPSGGTHGEIEVNIAVLFRTQPAVQRVGHVLGSSAGFRVARDPDRVLSPDVSILSFERCPTLPARGFAEGAPDVAVEIRSPCDAWTSVVAKAGVWIGHGARVVWCVDPESQAVLVLRPGTAPTRAGPGARASLRPVVDLDVEVAQVFGGP